MPNHVEQDVTITGNPETLKQFQEFAKEGEKLLSANKFIPYPEKFRKLDEEGSRLEKECAETNDWTKYSGFTDGFNSGGYEWCIQNWGTKWGIYDVALLSEKLTGRSGKLKYTCQSAWSPALRIFEAMSKKFPELKFEVRYYECGMQFKGHYVIKGGAELKHEQSHYRGSRGG